MASLVAVVACPSLSMLAAGVNIHWGCTFSRCWCDGIRGIGGIRSAVNPSLGGASRWLRSLCTPDLKKVTVIVIDLASCLLPGLKIQWE